jgi:ABC-type transporter MlaC component
MIVKLWQLKGVFLLIGLFIAFAACVKEKDPNLERNQIKENLNQIIQAINNKDLQALNQHFAQPIVEGKGPNALLAVIATKGDSAFTMCGRRFSIDGKKATVRFTFTDDPNDTTYSYLYLAQKGDWKITGFEMK